MPAPEKIAALRHLLAERFSAARTGDPFERPRVGRALLSGIPSIDDSVGGLPLSAVTELVCETPSCGSHLLLGQLLASTRTSRTRVALVDGGDSFDPASLADDLFAHLLWVRCRGSAEALQAVDLLARDANLGLVVLDLRRASDAELRRTPSTQWYRLQRAVEPTDMALLVETPFATVPSAQLRLVLNTPHAPATLDADRSNVVARLQVTPARQRLRIAKGA